MLPAVLDPDVVVELELRSRAPARAIATALAGRAVRGSRRLRAVDPGPVTHAETLLGESYLFEKTTKYMAHQNYELRRLVGNWGLRSACTCTHGGGHHALRAARRLGMLAAVARGDQDGGQDRAGDRKAGADEERAIESFGQGDRCAVHA
jgi:hypothetical protein